MSSSLTTQDGSDINYSVTTGVVYISGLRAGLVYIYTYNPTTDTFGDTFTLPSGYRCFALAPIGDYMYMSIATSPNTNVSYKKYVLTETDTDPTIRVLIL